MSPEPKQAPLPASPSATADGGWTVARPTRMVEVFKRLLAFPRLLIGHRDLISTSVRRDLESRFRGTILGWVWPLVQPLFLFVVYYFIFSKLLNFKIPDLPEGYEAALGVYMFVGIMAFAMIGEALTRGTGAIVDNGNLIKKLAFPSEILPLNVTLVTCVTLMFAVVVFIVAVFVTPVWPAPGAHLLWILPLLLVQTLFTYGLVLFLSTLQVFLRDTIQFVGIFVTIWMFITPLFWVPELMGDSLDQYRFAVEINPLYHMVTAWRGALMGTLVVPANPEAGRDVPVTPIDVAEIPGSIGIFALWAVGIFIAGYTVFVLSQRRFADEV